MSYTTVYTIEPDGDVKRCATANNAWGTAPLIWDLCSEASGVPSPMRFSAREEDLKQFWALFNSGRLDPTRLKISLHAPPHIDEAAILNTLLGFTYDRVWVKRENIHRLVEALTWLDQLVCQPRDRVRTAFDVAKIIDGLERGPKSINPEAVARPEIRGVCFGMTSVSDTGWRKKFYHEGDDPNEVDPDDRPYNFDRDTGHWELFTEPDPDAASSEPVDRTGGTNNRAPSEET